MSSVINNKLYYMPAAEKILEQLGTLIDVNSFFLASNDKKTNIVLKAFNKVENLVQEGATPYQESYCSKVLNKSLPTVISNTFTDLKTKDMPATKIIGRSSYAGFPIVLRNGETFGTLCAMDRKHDFTNAELEIIVSMAQFMGYLIDLERDLFFDALTGLYTRHYLNTFSEEVDAGLNENFSVFLININRFKYINASEELGNFLLVAIANRIQNFVGANGLAVRLHGDEFVAVAFGLNNEEAAKIYAESLSEAISLPILTEFQEFRLKASIGICISESRSPNMDQLIKQARFAIDEINQPIETHRYAICTAEIIEKKERQIWIESNMLQQLEDNQFEMYYQPQYHIPTGDVIGFEALIRWNSNELGSIPPSEFIPIAESTGQIIPLGNWIFQTVCQQLSIWNKKYEPNYSVGVNVSPAQFRVISKYAKSFDDYFIQYDIKPEQIHLEITETSLLSMDGQLVEILTTLREKGIRIALDDFGTGYSSIVHLRNLPVDILKIDRTFVQDIASDEKTRKIIGAIIDLAKELEIEIVAEGIESSEILDILDSLGCDIAQGYLLNKPLPSKEIVTILGERTF